MNGVVSFSATHRGQLLAELGQPEWNHAREGRRIFDHAAVDGFGVRNDRLHQPARHEERHQTAGGTLHEHRLVHVERENAWPRLHGRVLRV
jgi:hypothetical protein